MAVGDDQKSSLNWAIGSGELKMAVYYHSDIFFVTDIIPTMYSYQ